VDIPEKDKAIVRDLARQLAEIAALPIQEEKRDLWRRLNRLERVRPPIFIQNDTWGEIKDEIKLEAEDEFARKQEWALRVKLYEWEHMRDDHVYEAKVYSPIVVRDTGLGVQGDETVPEHSFGARHYNCVIEDDADPSMITMPTVTVDWEETEKAYERLSDLYDGILTVEKRGVAGHWFTIMDQFIMWRDIDNTFADLVDRPQWVHAWMERLTEWYLSRLEQYEELGALSLNNGNNGIGSGGFGFSDQLPQPDFDGERVRAVDQWGHATTQIFSLVSPAMHDEFALTYERRFLERFGLNSYGCCEPLDTKMDIVRTIPKLRRVSMSPWVDVARGAEAMGSDYVFSYRPNPAILGGETWDLEFTRNQLRDVLEKTRDCIVEVVMIALYTCRGEPRRMWEWVDMAMEMSEEYA